MSVDTLTFVKQFKFRFDSEKRVVEALRQVTVRVVEEDDTYHLAIIASDGEAFEQLDTEIEISEGIADALELADDVITLLGQTQSVHTGFTGRGRRTYRRLRPFEAQRYNEDLEPWDQWSEDYQDRRDDDNDLVHLRRRYDEDYIGGEDD